MRFSGLFALSVLLLAVPLYHVLAQKRVREPSLGMQRATFAAGCYWGTERYFKKQFPGIRNGLVGFMGGTVKDPTYRQVCGGDTGHAEVYSFEYDPKSISFPQLVEFFFRMHNSCTKNRQGNDQGTQYRSAIFYHSEEQKAVAEEFIRNVNCGANAEFKAKLEKAFGKGATIVTTVEPAGPFYPAQADHQEYLDNNPGGYCNHRIYIQ